MRCATGNHGRCVYHVVSDISFGECNYHDSLQGRLIEGLKDSGPA